MVHFVNNKSLNVNDDDEVFFNSAMIKSQQLLLITLFVYKFKGKEVDRRLFLLKNIRRLGTIFLLLLFAVRFI